MDSTTVQKDGTSMTMTATTTSIRQRNAVGTASKIESAYNTAQHELDGIDTIQRWYAKTEERMLDVEIDLAADNVVKNYPHRVMLNNALDALVGLEPKAATRKDAVRLVLRRKLGLK